ncbi:ATP-binding protein [Flavobacterium nitrogenifigens]|uniref:DNA-binding domain-containing protein n=1 Tax=Flavobacterium nitrogenifigens TaxID=1617283 RepID=A0A521DV19_9FLAO|nr:ATP-binding protein [Flavobacterium nitrogenifigens]KAF2327605.1 ATP-binding protein [Flavobacterium nitrogenifigens]SMO75564.1 Putative DNA-binding domain-containing protein [Flavobacterium nitrogenifigens]
MITEIEFEKLISKNESSILDFKGEFYDFKKESNDLVTAKFVKDVISFCNTIRTETSYIIFGIQEIDNGGLEFKGMKEKVDDAILQDKIKDKVIPRPNFSFYTIKHKEKQFGILEFPIIRYEMPIVPAIKNLKGLEVGKVYYRNGTSNTEATAYDVIRINDWLKSLPEIREQNSLNDEVSKFIKELTKNEQKLSVIISDLFSLSKKYELEELRKFCLVEIQGIKSSNSEGAEYRIQKVFISWNKIEINPYAYLKPSISSLIKEIENNKEFFESKIVMHHPIIEIESSLDQLNSDPNSYGTMKTDAKELLDMEKAHDLYIYTFPDNINSLYRNIRQKAIDILMKI